MRVHRLIRPLLAGLVALFVLTACGDEEPPRADLRTTCAAVREAFPPTLYDDRANADFADELETILATADTESRRALRPLERALQEVVDAAGDNSAVVTANVELLATLDEVNQTCRDAGAAPVRE